MSFSSSSSPSSLSASEAALYDRQIRLWGASAQAQLRSSRLLVVGTGMLASEACKNAVLAGIGKIEVLEFIDFNEKDDVHSTSIEEYSRPHVLWSGLNCSASPSSSASSSLLHSAAKARHEAVTKALQELNPHVEVTSQILRSDDSTSSNDGLSWSKLCSKDYLHGRFDIVFATLRTSRAVAASPSRFDSSDSVAHDSQEHGASELGPLVQLDSACRQAGVCFIAGDVAADFGWFFSDLGPGFQYAVKIPQGDLDKKRNAAAQAAVISLDSDMPHPAKRARSSENPEAAPSEVQDNTKTESMPFPELRHSLAIPWADVQKQHPRLPEFFFSLSILGGAADPKADDESLRKRCLGHGLREKSLAGALEGCRALSMRNNEIPAVAAVLGGVVGQEIIKIASRHGKPIANWFFYTATDLARPGVFARIE